MPFSQSTQLSSIMGFIEGCNPSSILDVGTGMGQYGFLTRTNLEHIHLFDVNGSEATQRPKSEWIIQIDGIEACSVYVTPVHDYVYNQLFIGNALEVLPTLPEHSYELVLAIDILEHFEKSEGFIFLEQLKRISRGEILVSTPKTFIHQEVEANPYENHRSLWTKEELLELGFHHILENADSWIVTS